MTEQKTRFYRRQNLPPRRPDGFREAPRCGRCGSDKICAEKHTRTMRRTNGVGAWPGYWEEEVPTGWFKLSCYVCGADQP